MSQREEQSPTRSPEPTTPTTPPTKLGKNIFPQGFSLVVGVGRCAYDPWSLPVTSADAEAFRDVLNNPLHCGYLKENVQLLTDEDATRNEILSSLAALGQTASQHPESTVVVYYSGHGWLDQRGNYYLVPYDTKPFDLENTALRAEDFNNALRRIHPERLLVVLDTCHAAGMAEAKEAIPPGFSRKALPEELADVLSRGQGRAVLSSCRGDQRSWILENNRLSLFTKHLIEAFKGEGSPTETEIVSVLDVMSHVSHAVEHSARAQGKTQTPFHKMEADAFPVAYKSQELGLPESKPKVVEAESPQSQPLKQTVYKGGRDIVAPEAIIHGDFTMGKKVTSES